jgi:hypothetical protein
MHGHPLLVPASRAQGSPRLAHFAVAPRSAQPGGQKSDPPPEAAQRRQARKLPDTGGETVEKEVRSCPNFLNLTFPKNKAQPFLSFSNHN